MGVSIDITESKHVELRLQADSEYLKDEIEVEGRFADIVGQSVGLKKSLSRSSRSRRLIPSYLSLGRLALARNL